MKFSQLVEHALNIDEYFAVKKDNNVYGANFVIKYNDDQTKCYKLQVLQHNYVEFNAEIDGLESITVSNLNDNNKTPEMLIRDVYFELNGIVKKEVEF